MIVLQTAEQPKQFILVSRQYDYIMKIQSNICTFQNMTFGVCFLLGEKKKSVSETLLFLLTSLSPIAYYPPAHQHSLSIVRMSFIYHSTLVQNIIVICFTTS